MVNFPGLGVRAENVARRLRNHGAIDICIAGKRYLAHRLAKACEAQRERKARVPRKAARRADGGPARRRLEHFGG